MSDHGDVKTMHFVVELDGNDIPLLAELDVTSIAALRSSLGQVLGVPRPISGPIQVWDRTKRYLPVGTLDAGAPQVH